MQRVQTATTATCDLEQVDINGDGDQNTLRHAPKPFVVVLF